MAYQYGTISESRLVTCHPQLIEICRELMAGTFLQIARGLDIDVRYGPDFMPSHIFDAYHFELI